MNKILKAVVGLLGLMFLLIGLRWLVAPSGAAGHLGMPLLDDVGRSTQFGSKKGTDLFLVFNPLISAEPSRFAQVPA